MRGSRAGPPHLVVVVVSVYSRGLCDGCPTAHGVRAEERKHTRGARARRARRCAREPPWAIRGAGRGERARHDERQPRAHAVSTSWCGYVLQPGSASTRPQRVDERYVTLLRMRAIVARGGDSTRGSPGYRQQRRASARDARGFFHLGGGYCC